jgi:hypothetical protein
MRVNLALAVADLDNDGVPEVIDNYKGVARRQ